MSSDMQGPQSLEAALACLALPNLTQCFSYHPIQMGQGQADRMREI